MKTSKVEKNYPEMNQYCWERLYGVRGDSNGWSFDRCDSSLGGIKFRWKDYNQKVSLRACVHACAVCLLRVFLRVSFVLYDMVQSTLLRYLRYGHHCILEVFWTCPQKTVTNNRHENFRTWRSCVCRLSFACVFACVVRSLWYGAKHSPCIP